MRSPFENYPSSRIGNCARAGEDEDGASVKSGARFQADINRLPQHSNFSPMRAPSIAPRPFLRSPLSSSPEMLARMQSKASSPSLSDRARQRGRKRRKKRRSISSGPITDAIQATCLLSSLLLAIAHFDLLQRDAGNLLLPFSEWLPTVVYRGVEETGRMSGAVALAGLVAQTVAERFSTARFTFHSLLALVAWLGLVLLHSVDAWGLVGIDRELLLMSRCALSGFLLLTYITLIVLPKKRKHRRRPNTVYSAFSIADTASSRASIVSSSDIFYDFDRRNHLLHQQQLGAGAANADGYFTDDSEDNESCHSVGSADLPDSTSSSVSPQSPPTAANNLLMTMDCSEWGGANAVENWETQSVRSDFTSISNSTSQSDANCWPSRQNVVQHHEGHWSKGLHAAELPLLRHHNSTTANSNAYSPVRGEVERNCFRSPRQVSSPGQSSQRPQRGTPWREPRGEWRERTPTLISPTLLQGDPEPWQHSSGFANPKSPPAGRASKAKAASPGRRTATNGTREATEGQRAAERKKEKSIRVKGLRHNIAGLSLFDEEGEEGIAYEGHMDSISRDLMEE